MAAISNVALEPAGSGNGYVAAWPQADDSIAAYRSLWSNAYDGASWGNAEPVENGNAVAVHAAMRDAAWSDPENLAVTPRGSGVVTSLLLANDAGRTLALWHQNAGTDPRIYGGIGNADGEWGEPVHLAAGFGPSESHVATDGTGFALIWRENDRATRETRVFARIHDGDGWGDALPISGNVVGQTQALSIASNGASYAAVWIQVPEVGQPSSNQTVWASIHENGGWSAPAPLSGGGYGQSVAVVAGDGGYAATWDTLVNAGVPVNRFANGAWSGPALVLDPPNPQARPSIATDGTGYLVYWTQGSGAGSSTVYASVTPTGQWKTSPRRSPSARVAGP